jgi:hypothetical protein
MPRDVVVAPWKSVDVPLVHARLRARTAPARHVVAKTPRNARGQTSCSSRRSLPLLVEPLPTEPPPSVPLPTDEVELEPKLLDDEPGEAPKLDEPGVEPKLLDEPLNPP